MSLNKNIITMMLVTQFFVTPVTTLAEPSAGIKDLFNHSNSKQRVILQLLNYRDGLLSINSVLTDIQQNLEDTKAVYYSLATLQKVASFTAIVLAAKAGVGLKIKAPKGSGMINEDPTLLAIFSILSGVAASILEISKNATGQEKNLQLIDSAIEKTSVIQSSGHGDLNLNSKTQSIMYELHQMKEQISSSGTLRNTTAGINIVSTILAYFGSVGDHRKFGAITGSIAMGGTLTLSIVDLLSLLKDSDRELVLKKVLEVQPKVQQAIDTLTEAISK